MNHVANPKDGAYAFINAVIAKDAQTSLQNATIIIRRSKIEAVGVGISIPKNAVIIDCKGKYIYHLLIYIVIIVSRRPSEGRCPFYP